MPSIKDESTIEAVARAFTSNGRRKQEALSTVGYADSYALESGRGCKVVFSNVLVRAAIARIDAKTRAQGVKSRKQRQEFWSTMMDDSKANRADRLRASELLGRSEADFTDNINDNREGLTITVQSDSGPKLSKETA